MTLKMIEGDLLDIETGVICHQVNCQGVMGAGLAKQIASKWPEVERRYQSTVKSLGGVYGSSSSLLGLCQLVDPAKQTYDRVPQIANMFGQDRFGTDRRHTNYGAVAKAFAALERRGEAARGPVHVPYLMGCDLAGGDWEIYSEIIEFYVPSAVVVRFQRNTKWSTK